MSVLTGALTLILTFMLAKQLTNRAWVGMLAALVLVLKFLIRRRRPEGEWGGIYRQTDPHSFPSGHAARSVLIAVLAVATFLRASGADETYIDRVRARELAELERRGHTLGASNGSFGGYQAIMFDRSEGVYYGASEVRKDGQAAGY